MTQELMKHSSYVIRLCQGFETAYTRLQTIAVQAAEALALDRNKVQFSDTRNNCRSKLHDCFGYLETAMVWEHFAHLTNVRRKRNCFNTREDIQYPVIRLIRIVKAHIHDMTVDFNRFNCKANNRRCRVCPNRSLWLVNCTYTKWRHYFNWVNCVNMV